MFKTLATSVLLFLSLFVASLASGQAISPTLGRNNNWTGINNFLTGHLTLGSGTHVCNTGVMAGYNADFSPICVTFSGGVGSVNGLSGTLSITNTDNDLVITQPNSSTIQINCAVGGCSGGGGGGTPAGGNGAFQTNQSGAFSGTIINGIVFGLGSSNPRAAVADTDFALPFSLTCSSGVSCPKTGENYAFTASGSAGSGNVAYGNFGQVGGYLAQGTTISGAANFYTVNPAWSQSQIAALFSRFNVTNISNCAIVSNVATLTGNNSYSPGDVIFFPATFFTHCTALNGTTQTVIATGLSQSQFEVNITTANASGAETAFSYISGNTGTGLVVIPPGLVDSPATAFTNTNAQVLDTRKGYGNQQLTQYGAKCDAVSIYVTLTAGSNSVTVGSSPVYIGQTIVVAQQATYGNMGTQNDWVATVTGFSYPNAILSANAPFSYTGFVTFGTNNQQYIQAAFNAAVGSVALWLPQCKMLTGTVRWDGQSLIGQGMSYSGLIGLPGQDVIQGQDSTPITAWSINASTGVTTFTIPAYSAHHILAQSDYPVGSGNFGDNVLLERFPVSTFFNGVTVNIATHPTPTTFTVNNAFGQSTSSSTESGLAASTTSVNNTGMLEEQYTLSVNNGIDPTFSWNHYNAAGTLTVEPPYYRPLLEFSEPANHPFAPGWGTLAVEGIANITQNSSTINVPCVSVNGHLPPAPVAGTTIVFPYQGGGEFVTTVSTVPACTSGNIAVTMAAPTPNRAAFTSTQAAWFTYTTPQTLAVAMPSVITLPYTITLALPFPPIPVWESSVSSHGHIVINGDEWDYMGLTFGGTAGGSPTLTLRNGPASACNATTGVCTVNSGGGNIVGSVVFPLNPCQAMYDNPYPVIPSPNAVTITAWSVTSNVATFTAANNFVAGQQVGMLEFSNASLGFNLLPVKVASATSTQFTMALTHANGSGTDAGSVGASTPNNAEFYAGICGGNAGFSNPNVDGTTTQFASNSPDIAHFIDVQGINTNNNPLGNSSNNGSMFIYQQGNNTGYGNTYDGLRGQGLWGGFMQGPSSVNQFYISSIGPTSTGQSIKNCTFRTGYSISLVNMTQSNIDRCDTYPSETSPYDGTGVGATTSLHLGYTLSEITAAGVTGTGQITVKDYNGEPENGNHFEFPPSVISDGYNITWIGNIFEGGYNIFGGGYQQVNGSQMSAPVFNYGNGNYFDKLYGLVLQNYDSNVYNGVSEFYNWGQNSTCQGTVGAGGLLRTCGVGFVQSYNGHDVWASMFGDNVHPNENVLGGMLGPSELATGFGVIPVFDSTELWWGQHMECNIGSSLQCGPAGQFDGFSGYIFIGPHQRITDAKMVMKANVRLKNSGTANFRILYEAANPGGSACSPNYNLAPQTFTATSTSWTPIQQPVDFTGYANCTLGIQIDSGSATNVLEIGYFNFVPFPGQAYMPLITHTVGQSCPVAGEFSVDATNFWICKPSSGVTFGAGTWDYYGTAH